MDLFFVEETYSSLLASQAFQATLDSQVHQIDQANQTQQAQ